MAHDVLVYKITTSYTGLWASDMGPLNLTADNFLHVRLDDATGVLTVQYTSASTEGAGTIYGTLTEGPNLYYGYGGAATIVWPLSSPYYQFCSGTVLRVIQTGALFPYASLSYNEGAAECALIPVCDLAIDSVYEVAAASSAIDANGKITVQATSSNGVIKYAINNAAFNYATQGQTSGVFTGLLPGIYTIYAKDEAGCTDNIVVTVPITEEYGVKYRLEFRDSPVDSGRMHRMDILERAYTGDLSEICGSGDPCHIRWNGDANDPNRAIIAGEYILNVLKLSETEFNDMFTQDDRKFKIIHYVDDVFYWSGFIFPQLRNESFLAPPLPLEFTAVDGLGRMNVEDFKDESGNIYKGEQKCIKLISEILKKTGLKYNIHQGINVLADKMLVGSSDLMVNGDFDDNSAWTQEDTGDDWTITGGTINALLTTAQTKKFVQVLSNSVEGEYTYVSSNTLSSINVGFDTFNLIFTFRDASNAVLHTATHFQGLNGAAPLTGSFITAVPVAKVEIQAIINSGSGIDITLPYFYLLGPIPADTLDLACVDTRIFEGKDCEYVLKAILEPFRAQIFQAMGAWWIVRLSEAVGTFDYRIFDFQGEFIATASHSPVKNLDFPTVTNAGWWVNKTQRLDHLRNYGYFSVSHNAARDNNLIDEGRFEPDDIVPLGSGNSTFKNWNFFVGQAGVKHGFEYVKNGESLGAALISYRSAGINPQADSKLYSIKVPVSRFSGGYLRLQFQYMVRPNFTDLPYIRLGWSLKMFNEHDAVYMSPSFPPDFSRRSNSEEIINELYVTSFGSWQTCEVTAYKMFDTATAEDEQMYMLITFYMHDHYGRDFPNITALKTFNIGTKEIKTGRKVMVASLADIGSPPGPSNPAVTRQYVSEVSLDAESLPEVVRPNSYASDYLWRQEKVINLPGPNSLVADFLIDNLSVALFPQAVIGGQTVHIEPPETVLYSEEVSTFIKSNLNKQVVLGDMPIFDDTNADIVHYNNENLIYRGWFRYANGEPTYRWARKGVDESKKILQILLEDFRDQFTNPPRKMSANFLSVSLCSFLDAAEEQFEGSRYRFMTMDFDCLRAEYSVDLVSVAVGDNGEPPVSGGEFTEVEHSDDFNTGI